MGAEARCQMAEEERDVYKILARRYQMRMEATLQRSGRDHAASDDSDLDSDEDVEEDDEEEQAGEAFVPPNGRAGLAPFGGLGAMLRSIQNESEGDDDDIDEEGNDEESVVDHDVHHDADLSGNDGGMEEDTSFHDADESNSEMVEQDGDVETGASCFPLGAQDMTMAHSPSGLVVRQPRTVSITCEDL